MATRRRKAAPKPAFSVTTLLFMGLGAMAVLGGLVWLALSYNHSGLLAVLLPILPVLFSFFVDQCRSTLEEFREDSEEDEAEETAEPTPPT